MRETPANFWRCFTQRTLHGLSSTLRLRPEGQTRATWAAHRVASHGDNHSRRQKHQVAFLHRSSGDLLDGLPIAVELRRVLTRSKRDTLLVDRVRFIVDQRAAAFL